MWLIIIIIGIPVFLVSFVYIAGGIALKHSYEKTVNYVKEHHYYSICSPMILRSMMEELNYSIRKITPFRFNGDFEYVLYDDMKNIYLIGKNCKEHFDLLETYDKITEAQLKAKQEAYFANHDKSYEYLKEAQKKLSEYIDKEAQNRVNILKETTKGMK